MKKTLSVLIIIVSGLIVSAILFGAGMMIGRSSGWGMQSMFRNGLSGWDNSRSDFRQGKIGNGYGMMNNGYGMMSNNGGSMMKNGYGMMNNNGCGRMDNGHGMIGNDGYGMMDNGYGMMGNGYGMMGNSPGMMNENWQENNPNVKPLTIDQTKQAVDAFLSNLNDPNLEVGEIMIFNNNSYALIIEKDTGIGAMELLVDPATLSVFPEYGPNMMWNLKYGAMNNGGMMGNRYNQRNDPQESMTISSQQASEIAQRYLDEQLPGYQVAEDVTPFYGYYTMDILKDGSPTGMLSVNGFNGQVFLHTWHGTFVEMSQ